jgi:hypothetical protein
MVNYLFMSSSHWLMSGLTADMIYDIFVKLQFGCHPVAEVQYTFTHK